MPSFSRSTTGSFRLSRTMRRCLVIWMGDWPEKVFRHTTGTVGEVQVDDFPKAKKSFLPPLPRSRPRYGEVITQENSRVAKRKPWTKGLYEGVIAADLISNQRLEQKNR